MTTYHCAKKQRGNFEKKTSLQGEKISWRKNHSGINTDAVRVSSSPGANGPVQP